MAVYLKQRLENHTPGDMGRFACIYSVEWSFLQSVNPGET